MTFTKKLMAAAIAGTFVLSCSAFALTKDEIKVENNRIAAEFNAAKVQCDSLKDNAKDICMVAAKGTKNVAKAELDARKKDTPKAHTKVRLVKAEADYDVAKEKCDDLAGNTKDVCIKDAKAVLTTAKANAKADKEVGDAKRESAEKVGEAHKVANEDKRDANYAAAKERCDKFAGDVKDSCIADAKVKFNVK